MKYLIRTWVLFVLIYWFQPALAQKINESFLKSNIEYLASDALGGRYPGTKGDSLAADFIHKKFEAAGLKSIGDQGFQRFELVMDVSLGNKNAMMYGDLDLSVGTDFTPLAFTKNTRLKAPVVWAGYGFEFTSDTLRWNDFEGLDLKGKWVMMLRGEPDIDNPKSNFRNMSGDRQKVLAARDKGAAGVILVNPVSISKTDELVKLFPEHNITDAGIPVLNLNRKNANNLIKELGFTVEQLEKDYNSLHKAHSFALKQDLDAATDLRRIMARTWNVMGLLEGSDPVLKNQYIVIGAHYDHLGMGGPGSNSRMPDTTAIHYGADDNASGTGGVMALAEALFQKGIKPKRSLIFVCFSAEEEGLVGSKYFVKHPPVEIKNMVCMFNFDMIGRLKNEKPVLSVSGTETALEFKDLTAKYDRWKELEIKYSPDGYGPSDQASFFGMNIPVLYFTTGVHTDYHTPNDHASRINFQGCAQVLDFASVLLNELSNGAGNITYNKNATTYSGNNNRTTLKVTLGIIPDYAGVAGGKGLLVEGVKKDGPANRGGIVKGDVITALDGKSVGDIYEYMSRLSQLEPGKTITVDIDRGGNKFVLLIKL